MIYCQLQSSFPFYLLACLRQGDRQSKILFQYSARPVGTRIHHEQSCEYFFLNHYLEITTTVATLILLNYFWHLLTDSKHPDLHPCFAFSPSD